MHVTRVFLKTHNILGVMFTSLLFMNAFLIPSVLADDTTIDSWVEAFFDIEFETGVDLSVHVTMNVHKLTTYKSYSAEEIRAADDQEMGALRYELYLMLKNQLDRMFPNADLLNFSMPTYSSENPEGKKGIVSYEPPAVFNGDVQVKLSSAFFGLNASVDSEDFINGVLDMDGIVSYVFDLQAENGWNNTYTIILPEGMEYRRTTGTVEEGNRIWWSLENWKGEKSLGTAEISIKLSEPTTTASNNEDIYLDFELDLRDTEEPVLKTNILAKTINIKKYGILPDFITNLDFVPADGIRLFIDNNFISWDDIYQKTIKSIEEKIVANIENSSFNQSFSPSFSWDPQTTFNCSTPYNITSMDNKPSIKAVLTKNNIDLQIYRIPIRAVFGLINAGATANISREDINFGDKLDEIGYPYNGSLMLPDNISLDRKNIYKWNQSNPIHGEMMSDTAPTYSQEEIKTYVYIDINKMDLNLPSFFTGKTELTVTVDARENIDIYIAKIPQEFSLPGKMHMKYINSDAFRLCVEEKVFNENDVNSFLTNKKNLFEEKIGKILEKQKIKGYSDKKMFFNSIRWDGDISNMDAQLPVTISSYSHSLYPTSFNLSLLPPSFSISIQKFNLTGMENQSVTYRIIFPKGVKADANNTVGKAMIKGKTGDGREYIEITFNSDESDKWSVISCKLSATPLYIVGVFLPCILSLIITVVLVLIIYLIRRRRGGKEVVVREEEKTVEHTGYENEDYYVPPPPPSSR